MFYISLNMVRAGAVDHPSEWETCGYHELAGAEERDPVVNRKRLLLCLRHAGELQGFSSWYCRTIDGILKRGVPGRDALWTESAAVGDMEWIESLIGKCGMGRREALRVGMAESAKNLRVRESQASYGLRISGRRRSGVVFKGP